MIEYKKCPNHDYETAHRDGDCIACRPIETINLNSAPPSAGNLARIATHLEMWGKVTIICSALCDNPGVSALALGIELGKQEACVAT